MGGVKGSLKKTLLQIFCQYFMQLWLIFDLSVFMFDTVFTGYFYVVYNVNIEIRHCYAHKYLA